MYPASRAAACQLALMRCVGVASPVFSEEGCSPEPEVVRGGQSTTMAVFNQCSCRIVCFGSVGGREQSFIVGVKNTLSQNSDDQDRCEEKKKRTK